MTVFDGPINMQQCVCSLFYLLSLAQPYRQYPRSDVKTGRIRVRIVNDDGSLCHEDIKSSKYSAPACCQTSLPLALSDVCLILFRCLAPNRKRPDALYGREDPSAEQQEETAGGAGQAQISSARGGEQGAGWRSAPQQCEHQQQEEEGQEIGLVCAHVEKDAMRCHGMCG